MVRFFQFHGPSIAKGHAWAPPCSASDLRRASHWPGREPKAGWNVLKYHGNVLKYVEIRWNLLKYVEIPWKYPNWIPFEMDRNGDVYWFTSISFQVSPNPHAPWSCKSYMGQHGATGTEDIMAKRWLQSDLSNIC